MATPQTFRAGDWKYRVTIYRRTMTRNEFGEESEDYSEEFATVWAQYMRRQSKELFLANMDRQVEQASFRIRYRPGVEHTMRISFQGLMYRITNILDFDKLRVLELYAEAIT